MRIAIFLIIAIILIVIAAKAAKFVLSLLIYGVAGLLILGAIWYAVDRYGGRGR